MELWVIILLKISEVMYHKLWKLSLPFSKSCYWKTWKTSKLCTKPWFSFYKIINYKNVIFKAKINLNFYKWNIELFFLFLEFREDEAKFFIVMQFLVHLKPNYFTKVSPIPIPHSENWKLRPFLETVTMLQRLFSLNIT